MYRKLVLFVLCVTLVLTTAGCYAQVEKPEQSTSVPADTTPRDTTLPREPPQPQADGPHFAITHVEPFGVKANTNIRLSVAGLGKGGYPTPDGEAMYLASSTVSYFAQEGGKNDIFPANIFHVCRLGRNEAAILYSRAQPQIF